MPDISSTRLCQLQNRKEVYPQGGSRPGSPALFLLFASSGEFSSSNWTVIRLASSVVITSFTTSFVARAPMISLLATRRPRRHAKGENKCSHGNDDGRLERIRTRDRSDSIKISQATDQSQPVRVCLRRQIWRRKITVRNRMECRNAMQRLLLAHCR
jgi:hypothetical protein